VSAPLTPRQRAHLRSLAHPLKPLLQIGREGVTAAVGGTVEDAFRTRELLKVKILEAAPSSARELGEELAATVPGVQLVQVIGRTIVLFRPHPETPEIRLPG
jgi:RNA-binding protein